MGTIGLYACDTGTMRVVASSDNLNSRFVSAVHTSDVGAGKVGDEDIFELPVDPVDEDLQSEEISIIPFYSRVNSLM